MKSILIIFPLLVLSCTTPKRNPVPDDSNARGSFEYCDGGLWGYVMPTDPRVRRGSGPRLATFLQMHSVNEKDPNHALTLHLAIKTGPSLEIKIADPTVKIRIDDGPVTEHKLRFNLQETALRPEDLYPYPDHDTTLIDRDANRWEVWDRNSFFRFIRTNRREVVLPISRVRPLSTERTTVNLDRTKFASIYVLTEANIWPAGTDLRDAKIEATLPAFTIDGDEVPPRTFTFVMRYREVKRRQGQSSVCPSTEMIFGHSAALGWLR